MNKIKNIHKRFLNLKKMQYANRVGPSGKSTGREADSPTNSEKGHTRNCDTKKPEQKIYTLNMNKIFMIHLPDN